MTKHDFKPFTAELALLAEVFKEELSSTRIEGYFVALDNLSFSQVRDSMRAAARTHRRFFPTPAELRDLAQGSPEECAELAWVRAFQAFRNGVGGYRPIDFGDPIMHAAIEAIGGWGRFHSLGFPGSEEVTISVVRKEFLKLYEIYLRRGAPAGTPAALCADKEPAFPEPRRLGDGISEPVVPVPRPEVPEPTEQIESERIAELLSGLVAHHRVRPEPARQLEHRRRLDPALQAPSAPPTTAEREAHEAKKARALSLLGAAPSTIALAGDRVGTASTNVALNAT